ncbi:discoidin domain-containing protein [Paenibacillaceae bacterium WGS1546]|uniref:discoidin domain-containing protein n=1 Tax=Cohnella sp. WGS1546 TaxID=3366810 RepID=UPI00372D1100
MYEVSKTTGAEVLVASDASSIDFSYLPGEGALYRIVNKSESADVKLVNQPGRQIFEPSNAVDYRMAPAIIVNADDSIDMWLQAPGHNGAWDSIVYRRSTDGGVTWTADQTVLEPTTDSGDRYCVSEPSVVKVGAYYYMAYTGCGTPTGLNRDVFVARSESRTGPFLKWNGHAWGGGAPAPLLDYAGPVDQPGIWAPSLILREGQLRVYYQHNQNGAQAMLATAADPFADHWPNTLSYAGVSGIPFNEYDNEEAPDFKYVDSFNRYIAVATRDRFGDSATVSVWQSEDGIHFERAAFQGVRTERGAHNVGISGDSSGHVDAAQNHFIVYGYQRESDAVNRWPTYMNPIAFGTAAPGTSPVAGKTSSSFNYWWSGPKLIDGDDATGWSSAGSPSPTGTEQWASIDLGKSYLVSGMKVTPNAGGAGFPVDFKLQYSHNQTDWHDIRGQSYAAYSNPGSGMQTFVFDHPVNARFLRIVASRLSTDGSSTYYMQLGEMSATVIVQ